MSRTTVPIDPEQAAQLLLAIQAGDAVACATLPIIRRDLERLGCSPRLRRTLPVLKAASAVGLLAGRRDPRLGRLTADAVVAYFVCALGAHARVRDPAWRWLPATGMLALALVARKAFAEPEVIDLASDEAEDDLTTPASTAAAPTVRPSPPRAL